MRRRGRNGLKERTMGKRGASWWSVAHSETNARRAPGLLTRSSHFSRQTLANGVMKRKRGRNVRLRKETYFSECTGAGGCEP